MKDFRELKVWQMGMELFEEVVKDVESFPHIEVGKIIANQILRSVSSITANIAEGYGRRKGKEFEHYLYIILKAINKLLLLYLCHARMFLSGIQRLWRKYSGFPLKDCGNDRKRRQVIYYLHYKV